MNNIVNIHGTQYVTVAGRVQMAHDKCKQLDITTEVLSSNPVVIKATIKTEKGTFTGISAANPAKQLEKQSPYEVAETSAVGRALGFAGFGIVEGIATLDEIKKAEAQPMDDIDKALNETYEEEAPKEVKVYPASEKQKTFIRKLLTQKGKTEQEIETANGKKIDDMTGIDASGLIGRLLLMPNVVNS